MQPVNEAAAPGAPQARDPWLRGWVALCLFVSALSIVVILDYTRWPFEPDRQMLLEFFLRTQDITGTVLLAAIALAACVPAARAPALALVDAVARYPYFTAGTLFVLLCLGTLFVEHNHPLSQDEYAALFQSQVFAAGRLTGQFPIEMLTRLIPEIYLQHFLYGSYTTGAVASAYWPGFALVLAPFSLVGAPWACNPALASLALLLMGRMAARLTGEPRAAGWAMLLALASPQFTGMAITYFSMNAHLLLNLVFAWLLMQGTQRSLLLAGVTGSLALTLHNPVPHTLFALPWIVWLATRPDRYRRLLPLAAGYLPLALLLGFGWGLLLTEIRGRVPWDLFSSGGDFFERVANYVWNWTIRARSVISLPDDHVAYMRVADQLRQWNWAVPALPALAALGWWRGRRDTRLLLLGLSMATTAAGFLFIPFEQGHGWGARYLHSAWGVLPILGAAALTLRDGLRPSEALRGAIAAAAVLSLVVVTPLRAQQIHGYLAMRLAYLPPIEPGVRQVVLIRFTADNYSADLVRNDPFLRDKVWMMMSFTERYDEPFKAQYFPQARVTHDDSRGIVWRLE